MVINWTNRLDQPITNPLVTNRLQESKPKSKKVSQGGSSTIGLID